jgi:hypothetical protein
MTEAAELRLRAENCRTMAREYHPSVGAPLYVKAAELEKEASRIDREGVERRKGALFP